MNFRITAGILLLVLGGTLLLPAASADPSCHLIIHSIPDGGIVSIDGSDAGLTPIETALTCNNHVVTIAKGGYDLYRKEISLKNSENKEILANLEYLPNRGSVVIRTEPPGATLYVDGIMRGTTPARVDNLAFGQHSVLITQPGYEPFHDTVTAAPGMVPEYREYLVPLPGTGFLRVESSEQDSLVFVDDVSWGTSPTLLTRVPSGNHTVLIQKPGFENVTSLVEVPGGESLLFRADLEKTAVTGTVIIDSQPSGAAVFINGTFKAYAPVVFENLPRGDYELMFTRGNYSSLDYSLTLQGGETREILAMMMNGTAQSAISEDRVYRTQSNISTAAGGSGDDVPSIAQTYTWYANGHEATVKLRIPQELYDYYKALPHQPQGEDEYRSYALTEQDRVFLHDLIGMLKDAGENKHYSARNDYRNAVAFVQCVRYENDIDPVTNQLTEYWKYPIETLADGSGDCEDTAILTAVLLKEMGYDAAIVLLPQHAAVAVACDNCNGYYYPYDGRKYYYLETTGAGFSPGTMDTQYQTAKATLIPL